MLKKIDSNTSLRKSYLLMIPILLSTIALFSFTSYTVNLDPYPVQLMSSDSIPDYITIADTIFSEVVNKQGIKCKSQRIVTNEFPKSYYAQNIGKLVLQSDTIITFDPESNKETMKVVSRKISKLYQDLINAEYTKLNPDFELISSWEKAGIKK